MLAAFREELLRFAEIAASQYDPDGPELYEMIDALTTLAAGLWPVAHVPRRTMEAVMEEASRGRLYSRMALAGYRPRRVTTRAARQFLARAADEQRRPRTEASPTGGDDRGERA